MQILFSGSPLLPCTCNKLNLFFLTVKCLVIGFFYCVQILKILHPESCVMNMILHVGLFNTNVHGASLHWHTEGEMFMG